LIFCAQLKEEKGLALQGKSQGSGDDALFKLKIERKCGSQQDARF